MLALPMAGLPSRRSQLGAPRPHGIVVTPLIEDTALYYYAVSALSDGQMRVCLRGESQVATQSSAVAQIDGHVVL
jgi:hypothetical protein